eukprot:TRINITY_DN11648_c0_g2_i1.p1 TRINITY_DN11648_c0_g2~~TRINITY_DN11648_c0_g2_i1.p1  ORF type:complete len:975 (-),score=164.03 TRINITY_DN11648_c0_g2_i1:229-3153(-)
MADTYGKDRIDQIVVEFFAKSLQIILDARIPFFSPRDRVEVDGPPSPSPSSTSIRGPDRWFNLELDRSDIVSRHVEPWRQQHCVEPLVVDVLLQRDAPLPSPRGLDRQNSRRSLDRQNSRSSEESRGDGSESLEEGAGHGKTLTLLERWVVQYERKQEGVAGGRGGPEGAFKWGGGRGDLDSSSPAGEASQPLEVPVVYKHAVVMLRSLYCMARSLPAHSLYRTATSPSNHRTFTLTYRICSGSATLSDADALDMSTWSLAPVETPAGRMCLSVAYRHTRAVTALEVTPSILPCIITDYVGSPNTDPVRTFGPAHQGGPAIPSSGPAGKGVHVVPLISNGPATPATMLSRRHSWGAAYAPSPGAPHGQVPPSSSSLRSPSPSSALQPHAEGTSYASSQPIMIHDSHRRPVQVSMSRSPSSSPSPPLRPSSVPHKVPRSASEPVTIPWNAPKSFSGNANPPQGQSGPPQSSRPQQSRDSHHPLPPQHSRSPASLPGSQPRQTSNAWQTSASPSDPASHDTSHHRTSSTSSQGRESGVSGLSSRPSSGGRSEGSGPGLGLPYGTSPPLPFASTPAKSSALLAMAPYEGQIAAITGASPPISGREVSALALARLPSFSLAVDMKVVPPLGRARTDPGLHLMPAVPYPNVQEVLNTGKAAGSLPAAARLSLYWPPQITGMATDGSSRGGRSEDGDEEFFPLPFAVDDEELFGRGLFVETAPSASSTPSTAGAAVAGVPAAPFLEHSGLMRFSSRQSQDAALGAFVRTLQTAPPLRSPSLTSTSPPSARPPAPATAGPPAPHGAPPLSSSPGSSPPLPGRSTSGTLRTILSKGLSRGADFLPGSQPAAAGATVAGGGRGMGAAGGSSPSTSGGSPPGTGLPGGLLSSPGGSAGRGGDAAAASGVGGMGSGKAAPQQRTSGDALEELKAYSEMRQVLLRLRGEGGRGGGGRGPASDRLKGGMRGRGREQPEDKRARERGF